MVSLSLVPKTCCNSWHGDEQQEEKNIYVKVLATSSQHEVLYPEIIAVKMKLEDLNLFSSHNKAIVILSPLSTSLHK